MKSIILFLLLTIFGIPLYSQTIIGFMNEYKESGVIEYENSKHELSLIIINAQDKNEKKYKFGSSSGDPRIIIANSGLYNITSITIRLKNDSNAITVEIPYSAYFEIIENTINVLPCIIVKNENSLLYPLFYSNIDEFIKKYSNILKDRTQIYIFDSLPEIVKIEMMLKQNINYYTWTNTRINAEIKNN